MMPMTSSKHRRTFLLALYCSGTLFLGSSGLLGAQEPDAQESPAGERPAVHESGTKASAIVLAERLMQRQTPELLLDPVRRDGLIHEIAGVLAQIREAYPEMMEISARQAFEPGMLLLGLEMDLLEAVSDAVAHGNAPATHTGQARFDALNATLGLSDMQLFRHVGVVALHFDGPVSLYAACRAYREIPGVRFAEPDMRTGDGPDMDVAKVQGTWYVIARKAWGDCPAGCIHEEFLYFTAGEGLARRIEASRAMEMQGFAQIMAYRGWN